MEKYKWLEKYKNWILFFLSTIGIFISACASVYVLEGPTFLEEFAPDFMRYTIGITSFGGILLYQHEKKKEKKKSD